MLLPLCHTYALLAAVTAKKSHFQNTCSLTFSFDHCRADRLRQAEMDTPERLSEAYLSGSSNRQDATRLGSSDLNEGFL